VGPQECGPVWVKRRHAGGELAPILDIEQHARKEPRNMTRAILGAFRTAAATGQVVNGCNTTLVM
jgi:hypothetical protein